MKNVLAGLSALLVLFLAGGLLAVPLPKAKEKYSFLNLAGKANQKLKDDFHTKIEGNNLAGLPRGEQKFAGAKFSIGDRLIQLASSKVPDKPEKVTGIPVGQKFTRLRILHATGYYVADGTVIGSYTIHYADKTKTVIPIVYGRDVRNWWTTQDQKDLSGGKVAWVGSNAATRKRGAGVRLYLTTWKNPRPKKKVLSIDFQSAKTEASPFCVAMTVESE
jgi:hypothetical protein